MSPNSYPAGWQKGEEPTLRFIPKSCCLRSRSALDFGTSGEWRAKSAQLASLRFRVLVRISEAWRLTITSYMEGDGPTTETRLARAAHMILIRCSVGARDLGAESRAIA